MEQIETVPSGSYAIKKREAYILRAFLGSCVGVALIDKENRIAGLYHILLPEPPSKGAVQEPEKYASTGMSLFLEDILHHGAKKENLEAFIAGGALVGQVSLTDLRLDIGGNSAEVAANFLAMEKIPVKKMETGGYLSSQISLNTATMECTIEAVITMHPNFHQEEASSQEHNIEEAIQQIKPIPQIALKVIRMINSQKVSMETIAEQIRQDQVLTAKVLQLSNSAYFNTGKKIDSIDRALIYLGEKRILLLTMSVFTELFYQQVKTGYSLSKGGLYRHALGVAHIAEKIAFELNEVASDIAYTAGLLHDIGKVVLDQYMAADFPLFYKKMIEGPYRPFNEIEKEVFGMDHNEIGGLLADRWDLPETVKEVVAFHHIPEKATQNPKLTHIIYLSDWLLHRFQSNMTLGTISGDHLVQRLDALGITSSELLQLIDKIEWNKIDLLSVATGLPE